VGRKSLQSGPSQALVQCNLHLNGFYGNLNKRIAMFWAFTDIEEEIARLLRIRFPSSA